MLQKYENQLITAVSFGLTTAVITSLGIIVGLYSATHSKLAMVSGILIMAIADGLSDAISLHTSEEAKVEKGNAVYTSKEIWVTTIFAFLAVSGFSATFVIPILILSLKTAVFVAIAWGILLLILLNFYIARIRKGNPIKIISEHIFLAIFVIIVSYLVGNLIAMVL